MTVPQLTAQALQSPTSPPVDCDTPYELSETLYPAGLRLKFETHHDAYFCFVLEGSICDIRATTYDAGRLVFFPANWSHIVGFRQRTHCLIIRIGTQLLSRLPMDLRSPQEPFGVPGWEATWLARRLTGESLRAARSKRQTAEPLLLEAIILQLLALVARRSRERGTGEGPFWLRKVRSALDAQYLFTNHRLSELASVAGVHPVHLAREFRKHYGTTIGGYIRRLRVEHASDLLSRTDLPLREIAATCRFVDQSHFSNQFKKQCGLTPAEYRDLVAI